MSTCSLTGIKILETKTGKVPSTYNLICTHVQKPFFFSKKYCFKTQSNSKWNKSITPKLRVIFQKKDSFFLTTFPSYILGKFVKVRTNQELGKFRSNKKKGTHYKSIHKVSQSEQVIVMTPYYVDHFLHHIMQLLAYWISYSF